MRRVSASAASAIVPVASDPRIRRSLKHPNNAATILANRPKTVCKVQLPSSKQSVPTSPAITGNQHIVTSISDIPSNPVVADVRSRYWRRSSAPTSGKPSSVMTALLVRPPSNSSVKPASVDIVPSSGIGTSKPIPSPRASTLPALEISRVPLLNPAPGVGAKIDSRKGIPPSIIVIPETQSRAQLQLLERAGGSLSISRRTSGQPSQARSVSNKLEILSRSGPDCTMHALLQDLGKQIDRRFYEVNRRPDEVNRRLDELKISVIQANIGARRTRTGHVSRQASAESH